MDTADFFEIHRFASVDSTNEAVKRAAAAGAPEGWLAVADEQTAGKGRRGRSWASPPGESLYFSFLLKPDLAPALLPQVTIVAGLAVANAIRRELQLPALIKWPNDIVIGGKKVCGILTEAFSCGGGTAVVVGIGINVNTAAFPKELQDRATSLFLERSGSGNAAPVDRDALLMAVLAAYAEGYARFMEEGSLARIREAYEALMVSLGKQVRIEDPAGAYTAVCRGIGADGAMRIALPDGTEQMVSSGEISVRGLYGYV